MTPPPVDDSTLPYGDEGPPSHPRSGEPVGVTISAATHAFLVAMVEHAQAGVAELRLIRIAWESLAMALSSAIARTATTVGWVLVGLALGIVTVGIAAGLGVLVYLAVG